MIMERWTDLAKHCYQRKCRCEGCSEEYGACVERWDAKHNEYGIKPMKYAVLMTYAEIGKPEGE